MFTGLIETKGTVAGLQKHPGGARFSVSADQFELTLGESIAVNGACVTVVEVNEGTFTVDLVPETLSRTNLGLLQVGNEVNLERAMAAGSRFGGHWVQGHIDCLGQVRSRRKVGNEELLEVTIPFEVARFIVPQGSITIDGVSLTVVDAEKDRLKVALIPFTRELTTLGELQPMDVVNVELDIVSKYLDRHIGAYLARIPRAAEEAVQRQPVSRADVTKQRVPMSRAATAGPRAERRSFDRPDRRPSDRPKSAGRRDDKRSDRRSDDRPDTKSRIRWNDEQPSSPSRGRGRDERPSRSRSSSDRPSRPRSSDDRPSRARSSDARPARPRTTGASTSRSRPEKPKYARPSRAKGDAPARSTRASSASGSAKRSTSGAKKTTAKRTTAAGKGTKRTTARVTKTTKRTTKTTRSPKRK